MNSNSDGAKLLGVVRGLSQTIETRRKLMNAKPEALTSGYIKVGRITLPIARKAHVKCADIMIDNDHIWHIQHKHCKELEMLGIDALNFVKLIASNYHEIRKAPDEALDLIIQNTEGNNFVAVVTLNYNFKKQFWEIRTAIPVRTAVVKSRKLLWKRERTPLRL
ncbi:MAG: hypothetical protein IKZ52_08395 [Bacteroidales bacterium]|nr:hypothetical protein [Bacteroidales bacterium]